MASTTASTALKSASRTPDQPTIKHPITPLERPPTIAQGNGYDRTDIASKIRSLEHFDAQILLHFAHDLYGVVELEMRILGNVSATLTMLHVLSCALSFLVFHLFSFPICPAFPPTFSDCVGTAYSVQLYTYSPIRINGSCFSAQ